MGIASNRFEHLHGSLVALVTPFRDGRIDEPALIRLRARQVDRGTAGLVVCGSTGEAPASLPDEQARVISIAIEVAAGGIPVIAVAPRQLPERGANVALPTGSRHRRGGDEMEEVMMVNRVDRGGDGNPGTRS
ncbi:MAG: dihydrodipicolinate synthase family protein [Acetobacteraceae bacterium]|nr:dihydrodipicolinate synthase family protein [Acetobacteraceae bacterium]